MADGVTRFREVLVTTVLGGPGTASAAERRAAFDHATTSTPATAALLDKVTRHAYKVTDEDVAAAKAAGATEDQLFELVTCAAIGQATRQLDSALAALDATPTGTAVPGAVSGGAGA